MQVPGESEKFWPLFLLCKSLHSSVEKQIKLQFLCSLAECHFLSFYRFIYFTRKSELERQKETDREMDISSTGSLPNCNSQSRATPKPGAGCFGVPHVGAGPRT